MVDTTVIIGTLVTIATLGISLYESYKKNIAAHKTTQGKIDAVITTTQKHENEINQLEKDIADLASLIKNKS